MMDNLRTIEAQTVQKLTNNEAWPKFTGSHKKKVNCNMAFSAVQIQLCYIYFLINVLFSSRQG